MAIAKICDICGGFYEPYNIKNDSKNPNGMQFLSIDNQNRYFSYKAIDCCPECIESIKNYIESLEKEKKNEKD